MKLLLDQIRDLGARISGVGRNDTVFGLAGDGVSAVQLAARARAGGLPLDPQMLVGCPTIAELAAALDATVHDTDTDTDTNPSLVSTYRCGR